MWWIPFRQCDAPPLNGFRNCVYTALNHLSECLTQLWKTTSIATYEILYFKCFLRIRIGARRHEPKKKALVLVACFVFGGSRRVTTLSVGLQWLGHKLWLHWLHKSVCKYPTLWWSHYSVDGGVSPPSDVSCDVRTHRSPHTLLTVHHVWWYLQVPHVFLLLLLIFVSVFKLSVLIIYLNLYLNLNCWLYVPNVCEGFCQNCLKNVSDDVYMNKLNSSNRCQSRVTLFIHWTSLFSVGASIATIHSQESLAVESHFSTNVDYVRSTSSEIHLTIIWGSHRIITFIMALVLCQ